MSDPHKTMQLHQLTVLTRAITSDWLCELMPSLARSGLKRFFNEGILPEVDPLELDTLYCLARLGDLEPSAAYQTRVKAARRYAERSRASEAAWRDAS